MTNTPEKSPEAQKALDRALTKWRGAGYPVDYSCRVKQPNGGTIHVLHLPSRDFSVGWTGLRCRREGRRGPALTFVDEAPHIVGERHRQLCHRADAPSPNDRPPGDGPTAQSSGYANLTIPRPVVA